MAPFLTLTPYRMNPSSVALREDSQPDSDTFSPFEITQGMPCIFSDRSYDLELHCEELSDIQTVQIYINDVLEPTEFSGGRISFIPQEKRIFLDCYGYVMLHLILTKGDGTEIRLRTSYFSVLVQHGRLNESVKGMVHYVHEHLPELLFNGAPNPRFLSSLKEHGQQTLSSQILLIRNIASAYEADYSYFKANCRSKLEKTPTVVPLERLQSITSATVQFIAAHPEQLRSVTSNSGIRVSNQVYQPQKVLSLQNFRSYDLYENRVILGFLQEMIEKTSILTKECDTLLQKIPSTEIYNQQYVYSTFYLSTETCHELEECKSQLILLHQKFIQLWNLYHTVLPITAEKLQHEPKPSAIFLSVPQYNRIFFLIHQWFQFGIYDLSSEKYMLSFLKISSLYESYLLAKMVRYFKGNGFVCTFSKKEKYNIPQNALYRNTRCLNTFCFLRDQLNLTLYFQPVISNNSICENDIELYRNNSILLDKKGPYEKYYYTPDFLLKIRRNEKTVYLILDAKFSTNESVRKYYVKDLAFKYLFSVSPVHSSVSIAGLCILYGKAGDNDSIKSAYDHQLPGCQILPRADIIPLMEGVNPAQECDKFDFILKSLLSLL